MNPATQEREQRRRGNGEFGEKPHTSADVTLPDAPVELADLRIGKDAVAAVAAAAAGGHNTSLRFSESTREEMSRAARAIAELQGKHFVTVPAETQWRDLIGREGHPGLFEQADGGVLFFEDATQLSGTTLDIVRQPLETGLLTVTTGKETRMTPADFQMIVGISNCPCGESPTHCVCTLNMRRRHRGRISGPIMDRVAVKVGVTEVAEKSDTSTADVRAQVDAARQSQAKTLAGTRWQTMSEVPGVALRGPEMRVDQSVRAPLDRALERGAITMRGFDRTLGVAWTLAAAKGHSKPDMADVKKAMTLSIDPVS